MHVKDTDMRILIKRLRKKMLEIFRAFSRFLCSCFFPHKYTGSIQLYSPRCSSGFCTAAKFHAFNISLFGMKKLKSSYFVIFKAWRDNPPGFCDSTQNACSCSSFSPCPYFRSGSDSMIITIPFYAELRLLENMLLLNYCYSGSNNSF